MRKGSCNEVLQIAVNKRSYFLLFTVFLKAQVVDVLYVRNCLKVKFIKK